MTVRPFFCARTSLEGGDPRASGTERECRAAVELPRPGQPPRKLEISVRYTESSVHYKQSRFRLQISRSILPERQGHLHIFAHHFLRYPMMQPQERYKLTHRAAFGIGHLVPDRNQAAGFLKQETAELNRTPKIQEALVDTTGPNTRLVRVYLRPLLMGGGEPVELLDAFVRTANEHQEPFELFSAYCDVVQAMANKGMFPFTLEDTNSPTRSPIEIMQQHQLAEYPAFSHSDIYRAHYGPATTSSLWNFYPNRRAMTLAELPLFDLHQPRTFPKRRTPPGE